MNIMKKHHIEYKQIKPGQIRKKPKKSIIYLIPIKMEGAHGVKNILLLLPSMISGCIKKVIRYIFGESNKGFTHNETWCWNS